jgi:hypothetical protein
MKLNHPSRFLLVLLAGLALGACANLQEPAKKVLADVESTLSAASVDAAQYAPEQYAAVNVKFADMKAAFDKQDYTAVIDGGPALLTETKGLADAAAAKKHEVLEALNKQWTAAATELPQAVAAIEARLATIKKTHKLPKGVTKDAVAGATAAVAELKSAWTEATSAFGAGNVKSALDKAKALKARADEIGATLGLGAGAKPAG